MNRRHRNRNREVEKKLDLKLVVRDRMIRVVGERDLRNGDPVPRHSHRVVEFLRDSDLMQELRVILKKIMAVKVKMLRKKATLLRKQVIGGKRTREIDRVKLEIVEKFRLLRDTRNLLKKRLKSPLVSDLRHQSLRLLLILVVVSSFLQNFKLKMNNY